MTSGSVCGHLVSWHTGDGEAAEVVMTPRIACLVHHAVLLPIHSFGSLTLALFAIVHNGLLWGLGEINLNAVVRVEHGCLCV